MEGFVNKNVESPFNYGLRNSLNYANYGVDKSYLKREEQNQAQQNTSSNISIAGIPLEDPNKIIVDTVTSDDKSNKHRLRSALIVGGSILGLGGTAFALTKGHIPKAITDSAGKLINVISEKTDKLLKKPNLSKLELYALLALQGVKHGADMIRGAVFNMTPFKDVVFDKFLRKTCKLQKPCDAVTNTFRNLSFSTVKSTYKKTAKDMKCMTDLFTEINSRAETGEFTAYSGKPNELVIKQLKEHNENIKQTFKNSFGEEAIRGRSNKLVKTFSGLNDKIYDKVYGNFREFFKNLKSVTTFVSEEAVAADKAEYMASLTQQRKIITNNTQDNYKNLSAIINEMKNIINPADKNSMEVFKSLKSLTKRYAGLSGVNETHMHRTLLSEADPVLKQAKEISKSPMYTPEISQKLRSLIQEYESTLKSDKKGEIEEILRLYKDILPPEEYVKAEAAAQKVSHSLGNAVHKEGFEYVDKARDLAIGSALTDVLLGMAIPVISTGAALSVADTREKKRSVMLKYGLPLLAGVATSTLCTIKLISGGKALITGAVSGLLTKLICEQVDEHLKKPAQVANADA